MPRQVAFCGCFRVPGRETPGNLKPFWLCLDPSDVSQTKQSCPHIMVGIESDPRNITQHWTTHLPFRFRLVINSASGRSSCRHRNSYSYEYVFKEPWIGQAHVVRVYCSVCYVYVCMYRIKYNNMLTWTPSLSVHMLLTTAPFSKVRLPQMVAL